MKSNILSYFIKDIKDQHELAFYKQINTNNNIKIFYKDKVLYDINYYVINLSKIWNFKTNIIKDSYHNILINYKMMSRKHKYGLLYYNKDNKINGGNPNYIYFEFKHKKYLNKVCIKYVMESKNLFMCSIRYYKCYKYIYKCFTWFKYKSVQIFIMNKYELHYNNIFFKLFFVVASRLYSWLYSRLYF